MPFGAHQRIAREPLEDLVEVPNVQRPPLRPHGRLEVGLELVTVVRTTGQQGEHGVLDRHLDHQLPSCIVTMYRAECASCSERPAAPYDQVHLVAVARSCG